MRNLSFIEMMALTFTAVAALASAVQAFVSFETRGEVSRAIVFSERISACSAAQVAIEPFAAKATDQARAVVANGPADGRYSLSSYYYRTPSGNAAFEAAHGPQLAAWRAAHAMTTIVLPPEFAEHTDFFDQLIGVDIPAGNFMDQAEMLAKLERLDSAKAAFIEACRNLL